MENILSIFQNDCFSPPPARNMRGFFLDLHFDNIMEVKTTKYGDPSKTDMFSLPHEFLSLELFHAQPPPIHQNVPCKFEKNVYCSVVG